MSQEKSKIAIYARSATKNIENIKHQIDMVKTGLIHHQIVEYIDNGFSGMTMNRPALKKLFRDVKSGKVRWVVFSDATRLSRNDKHLPEICKKLKVDISWTTNQNNNHEPRK